MGIDYEYHLYFPQERMWDVLQTLVTFAKPVGETTIALPDRQIVLPFTSGFKDETIIFDGSIKAMGFDTSLYFVSDDLLEDYLANNTLSEEQKNRRRDDKGRIAVGYIYLTVRPDLRDAPYIGNWKPGICLFEFGAATDSMSLLFERSKSIRRTFKRLLKQHGGYLGCFHDPDYYHFQTYVFWPLGMSVHDAKKLIQIS